MHQRHTLIALMLLALLLAGPPGVTAQDGEPWDVPKLGPWDTSHDQLLYCAGGGALWISPVSDSQALVACIPYPTATATFTPPPTATQLPSPLETPTPTATYTPTLEPTATWTATWTATPTATSPPTDTPTEVPEPTATPTPPATATMTATEEGDMGITVATTRVAAATSTGTQDITTTDLGGLTPKAALFILTTGVTDGTAADHALLAVGAATGASNEWGGSFWSTDALSSTDRLAVETGNITSASIYAANAGGTAIAVAEFSAWLTNGVRINWTTAPGSAYLLTVVLFGGTDLSAHANFVQAAGKSVSTLYDITDPGFEPDVLITFTTEIALGLVHNDGAGTIVQEFHGFAERDARTTSQIGSRTVSNAASGRINFSGLTVCSAVLSAFDGSGFSLTYVTDVLNMYYLALSFGGAVESYVGTATTPSSATNLVVTAPGFEPQAVIGLLTSSAAVDTAYTDGNAGRHGVMVLTEGAQYSNAIAIQDALATGSNTQSLSDNQAVNFPLHDGSAGHVATFTSFDANGFTLAFSAAPAAVLWPYLAIGAEEAGVSDLSVSVSDSASLSESVTLWTDLYHRSISDSASVADTPALEITTALSVSDSIGVTDTPALFLQELVASVSDSVTVADTPALDLPIALAVSDTILITDNFPGDEVIVGEDIDLAIPVALAVSENIALTEQTTLAVPVELAVAEAIGVADTPTLAITTASLAIAVSEAVGVTDTPTLRVRAPWYNTDTLTVTTGSITSGAITDTWTSDDTRLALAEVTGTPGFDYSFTFYDVPATVRSLDINGRYQGNAAHDVKLYQWNFTLSQWVALTANDGDIAASVVDEDYEFVVNYGADFLVAGELRLRIAHTSPGNPVHVLYLDWIQLATHPVIEVADTVTPSENLALFVETALAVQDPIGVGEAVNLLLAEAGVTYVSASDNVALSEVLALQLETALAVQDTVSTSDTPSLVLVSFVTAAEAIALSDTPTLSIVTADLVLQVSDNVGLNESQALAVETSLAVQDGVTVQDQPGLATAFALAVQDTLSVADQPSLTVLIGLAVQDGIALNENLDFLASDPQLIISDGVGVNDDPTVVLPGNYFDLATTQSISVVELVILSIVTPGSRVIPIGMTLKRVVLTQRAPRTVPVVADYP